MNTVRLLPLLAIAAICLFALKSAGLIFSGGYMLTGSAPASAQDTKPEDVNKEAAAETPAAEESETPAEEAVAKDEGEQQPAAPEADEKAKVAAADDVPGGDAGKSAWRQECGAREPGAAPQGTRQARERA